MKYLTLSVVLLLLAGCSPSRPDPTPAPAPVQTPFALKSRTSRPPDIFLRTSASQTEKAQFSSYCWTLECADYADPDPETFTNVDQGRIILDLVEPLPDKVRMSLNPVHADGSVDWRNGPETDVSPVQTPVEWTPTLPPGNYVLTISGSWVEGDASYWIAFEVR